VSEIALVHTGELPITMLACACIGAVHSVVFAGFSAESLASRVADCKPRVVVTTSGVMRGKKKLATKAIVDDALNFSKREGFEVRTFTEFVLPGKDILELVQHLSKDASWDGRLRI
jgi:acyl-coenzyme A synthetase/AMP-(fatty) acid ligase